MTANDIREVVLAALVTIAPEADPSQVDPHDDVREALDLDSMDILRLAAILHERLGVDVPEADYGQIATIDGCVAYLERRLGAASSVHGQ